MIDNELEAPKNELDKEMESTTDVEQTQEVESILDQELEKLAKEEFGDENQELIDDFVASAKEDLKEAGVDINELNADETKELLDSAKEELFENFENKLDQEIEKNEGMEDSKEDIKATKNELDGDYEEAVKDEELKTRSR